MPHTCGVTARGNPPNERQYRIVISPVQSLLFLAGRFGRENGGERVFLANRDGIIFQQTGGPHQNATFLYSFLNGAFFNFGVAHEGRAKHAGPDPTATVKIQLFAKPIFLLLLEQNFVMHSALRRLLDFHEMAGGSVVYRGAKLIPPP